MRTRALRRAITAAIAIIAVSTSLLVAGSASANASTPTAPAASAAQLCVGYAGCAALGMTNHGYLAKNATSYWRMYPGHNCTNYAAYLMVSAGAKNKRPFTTSGDAWGWGHGLTKKTNATPTVGAIAWWDKNSRSGSLGHVAYVEAVISPTAVIISEDNYGGNFDWRIVTRASGWPDGFIHVVKTQKSTVPGLRTVTEGVRAWNAAWGTQDLTHVKPGTTLWLRARYLNAGTKTWTGTQLVAPGAGALATGWLTATHATVQEQAEVAPGQWATYLTQITVPATASTGDSFSLAFHVVTAAGSTLARSVQNVVVTADTRDPFTSTPTPTISGTVTQESLLTAVAGVWQPTGATLSYQWLRDGKKIAGATWPHHRVSAADVSHRLSVTVHASAHGRIPVTRTSALTRVAKSKWPSSAKTGVVLVPGRQLVSTDGKLAVLLRTSGSLVVVNRATQRTLWTTGRVHAARLVLKADGNLTAYNAAQKRVWSSHSAGSKGTSVTIRRTGRFEVLNASGSAVWKSRP